MLLYQLTCSSHEGHALGMIGKREVRLMKETSILMDCARGGTVDEEALLDALGEKRIFSAASDAMDVEPLSSDVHRVHLANDNLVLTPQDDREPGE